MFDESQNILYIAVKFEKENTFKFILKQSWVDNLINQKDAEGNTLLHIYTVTVKFRDVDLMNYLQADQNVVNKKNPTHLGVVVHSNIFSKREVKTIFLILILWVFNFYSKIWKIRYVKEISTNISMTCLWFNNKTRRYKERIKKKIRLKESETQSIMKRLLFLVNFLISSCFSVKWIRKDWVSYSFERLFFLIPSLYHLVLLLNQ